MPREGVPVGAAARGRVGAPCLTGACALALAATETNRPQLRRALAETVVPAD